MSNEMSNRATRRVTNGDASGLLRGTRRPTSRDDSVVAAVADGGRVSPGRVAPVIDQLTDRDRQLISSVTTMRLASGRQLQRLHFGPSVADARRAGRTLKRLTEVRVLGRLSRRIGGVRAGSAGFVYRLDVIGQAVSGHVSGRRPWHVGTAFVEHGLLVSECYTRLVEAVRAGRIELTDFRAEAAAWQIFAGPYGEVILKPDALAVIGNGPFEDRWWLEVDNDTENPARIRRKAESYVQAYLLGVNGTSFPKVLWITVDAKRCNGITRALAGLPETNRSLFQVCTLDNFTGTIMAGPVAGHPGETP